jgi:hypothetical protein
MEIINAKLDFISIPEKRDTDFYSATSTKVILMWENIQGIDINFLHQAYKEINFTGIPYHYVVMESGIIYLARPRIYRSGFRYSYQNLFKNGICILVEGYDPEEMSEAQKTALAELLTMIVMQDNLLITDIISMYTIYYGTNTTDFRNLITAVITNVTALDPYRATGDEQSDPIFRKIVAGGRVDTFDTISKYTRIPKSNIINMNPHITLVNGIIPPGTTVFLPKNRSSGYNADIVNVSVANAVYYKIINKIADFKALLKSYGNEVN